MLVRHKFLAKSTVFFSLFFILDIGGLKYTKKITLDIGGLKYAEKSLKILKIIIDFAPEVCFIRISTIKNQL